MATTADWHIDVIPGRWINKKPPSKQRALHEGRQTARSRWLLRPRAGGLQTKREKWARGEAADWWDHWGQGWKSAEECHPAWKLHVISFFNSPHFICSLFSSFPFVILFKLFLFLASVSKHFLLFSPILCPFLTLLTLSFPATLFISFFIHLPPSLWHCGVILAFSSLPIPARGCSHGHTVWKRRIYVLASLSKSDLDMAR